MRGWPSVSGSRRQTTTLVAGGQIWGRVATHTPLHGEIEGGGATRKERCGTNENNMDIPEAPTGVACRAIVVCDSATFGLFGLVSS
jgi:hypothetical protein